MTRVEIWQLALGLLFEVDVSEGNLPDAIANSPDLAAAPNAERQAAESIAYRVTGSHRKIDRVLRSYLRGFTLERLASVDRNLLRMGLAELTREPTTDARPVIRLAAELASRYGTAESSRFVASTLAAIQRDLLSEGDDRLDALDSQITRKATPLSPSPLSTSPIAPSPAAPAPEEGPPAASRKQGVERTPRVERKPGARSGTRDRRESSRDQGPRTPDRRAPGRTDRSSRPPSRSSGRPPRRPPGGVS